MDTHWKIYGHTQKKKKKICNSGEIFLHCWQGKRSITFFDLTKTYLHQQLNCHKKYWFDDIFFAKDSGIK